MWQKENQTETKTKERRREMEGNSARGLLPDLYNSFIIEAVQSESRAKAHVKRNTHTHLLHHVL